MRILLVSHFFPPGHLGGTEALTLALAHSLQKQKHDVQVVCAENWDKADDYKIAATSDIYEGIPVRRLHFNWAKAPDVFGYLFHNPEVEAYMTAFLDEYKPAIVHITSCYSLSASVITAAHRAGLPIVVTATDFWFLCARNTLLQADDSLCSGPEHAWKCAKCQLNDATLYQWPSKLLPEWLVARMLMHIGKFPVLTNRRGLRGMHGDWNQRFTVLLDAVNKADIIVTASRLLRDLLIQYGVPADKIVFRTYGLDTSWAEGLQTENASDALRLGYIGQIIPMKGPDILVRAVRTLASKHSVHVRIYGDVEDDVAYGQQLRDLTADDPRIAFMGTFPYDQIGQVLAEMDALVVPSIWYDFPLVIESAFATGTPVIATDMPGMNEMVQHEVDGLLFKRRDVSHLAETIERLVTEPRLLESLRAGISPVKTVETMADEYCQIYTTLREPV